MYDFYRERLPDLQRQFPADALFHLLIAGGTPQMNTMLLFVGSEIFGRLARPIYVSPDRDRALPLAIVRQLYAEALRRNLAALLHAYAYGPAADLIQREAGAFSAEQEELLTGVLRAVEARRNFDFSGAAAALDPVFARSRNCSRTRKRRGSHHGIPRPNVVERRGLEPRTLCLQSRCSPN